MIIKNVIKEKFGKDPANNDLYFTGREYISETPTDTLIVFCHGVGERGPLDGRDLAKVEFLNGLPRHAKGIRPGSSAVTGFNEYPFNIFAIQVPDNYNNYWYQICPYVINKYQPKTIIFVAISMGVFFTYRVLQHNANVEQLKGVVLVTGMSDNYGSISSWRTVKGLAWHSTDDTHPATPYEDHKKVIDLYNKNHNPKGGNIHLNTISGVGHGAWLKAFMPAMDDDPSYKFIVENFAINQGPAPEPEPTPEEIIAELQAQLSDLNTQVTELKAQKDALQSKILQIQSILQ